MEKERRENKRVQVDVQGELFLGDKTFPATVLNISLGGCLIETSARPRMREIVVLQVRNGMSMERFYVKVAWQSYGQGLGKIGTQFYGMKEEQVNAMVASILGISHRHLGEEEKNES